MVETIEKTQEHDGLMGFYGMVTHKLSGLYVLSTVCGYTMFYPLVNFSIAMEKLTFSMAIFNSYASHYQRILLDFKRQSRETLRNSRSSEERLGRWSNGATCHVQNIHCRIKNSIAAMRK